jgi:MFS family permease
MTTSRTKQDPFAATRIAEYRQLLMGRFLFIMGLRMMGTLVGWWVYELTNDPFAIGLIGLAEVIPAVSLSLYAGHVIDISEKRGLLLKGVSLYLACALLLVGLSTHYTTSQLSNHWIAFTIYVIIFLTGIFRSFTGPTFGVMIGSIVPKELLQNATTWNQGTWLTASVTGHATVGFLIAGIGNTGSLIIISLLVAGGLFFMYQIKPKPALNEPGEKKTLDSVKEGLQFVFRSKEVLGALSLDLFAVLFGGAVAMIPVFAKDILKVGPVGFGWLNAASDIGSILIVIVLTLFPMRSGQGRKLLFAVGGFGICIVVFALSKIFWLSFAVLLLSGVLDGISVVVRSNELGQFESGVAAKLLGVIPSVVFGGCMTMLVVATTWFKAPSLRKMEY